jgi:hypothetical protein
MLCIATTAHAGPRSGTGLGLVTCAKFNEHRTDPVMEEMFFSWAEGDMTGVNDALQDTIGKYRDLSSLPPAQQKEILRQHCLNNPNATYQDGINLLMSKMTIVPTARQDAPAYPLEQRRGAR